MRVSPRLHSSRAMCCSKRKARGAWPGRAWIAIPSYPPSPKMKPRSSGLMRASGSDVKMKIAPAVKLSLEEALEYISGDEYVELTPKSIRLRKIHLDENERKRYASKMN